jgi:hypothetical protein
MDGDFYIEVGKENSSSQIGWSVIHDFGIKARWLSPLLISKLDLCHYYSFPSQAILLILCHHIVHLAKPWYGDGLTILEGSEQVSGDYVGLESWLQQISYSRWSKASAVPWYFFQARSFIHGLRVPTCKREQARSFVIVDSELLSVWNSLCSLNLSYHEESINSFLTVSNQSKGALGP